MTDTLVPRGRLDTAHSGRTQGGGDEDFHLQAKERCQSSRSQAPHEELTPLTPGV